MGTVSTVHAGPYTVADLEKERDRDERMRWELIDGELVMTPSPVPLHQQILRRLSQMIGTVIDARHPDLEIFSAPMDLRLSSWTVLQPDLWVVPLSAVGDKAIAPEPLLAIEILSPSTRRRDLEVKLDLLEAARCPQYWVIDPEEISMRMWELAGDAYALTRHARGADLITVQRPVELTFRLEQLWPARQA